MRFLQRNKTPILLWGVGAGVFFRRVWFSRFDRLMGDGGDVRLISVIHEHWFQVLRGKAAWRDPYFYYPQKNVLGYTDTFLLNQVFFAPLRALGVERFLALQLTFILMTAVGFAGMVALLRRVTSLSDLPIGLIAASGVFANAMAVKSDHPQTQYVYILPWIALLWIGPRSGQHRKRSMFLAGLLAGLLLFSGFYVGWFSLFALGLFTPIHHFVREYVTPSADRTWQLLGASFSQLISGAAGFVLVLVPFWLTYGPVAGNADTQPISEPLSYAPKPLDVLNLGPDNLVWRSTLRSVAANHELRLSFGEVTMSLTPGITVLFVGATLYLFWIRRFRPSQRDAKVDVAATAALTAILLRCIPMQLQNRLPLWSIAHAYIPGAKAIRAIDRLQLLNLVISAVVIGLAIDHFLRTRESTKRRRAATVLSVVLAVCLFEQTNVGSFSRIERSEQLALLEAVPKPPASCDSFFLTNRSGPRAFAIHNTEAMSIAYAIGLPTLNGYSGQAPEDYSPDPELADHIQRIKRWAARNRLENVCALERTTLTWTEQPWTSVP